MAETQTTIYREAPEIEAARTALMRRANELSLRQTNAQIALQRAQESGDAAAIQAAQQELENLNLPGYQVAELSNLQQAALRQAAGGIGDYQPYLSAAGESLGGNVQSPETRRRIAAVSAPSFVAAQRAPRLLPLHAAGNRPFIGEDRIPDRVDRTGRRLAVL